jgi:hypothetical protein
MTATRAEKRSDPDRREVGGRKMICCGTEVSSVVGSRAVLLDRGFLDLTELPVSGSISRSEGHDQVRRFSVLLISFVFPRLVLLDTRTCGQDVSLDQRSAASCPYHRPLAASAISTCPPRPCVSSRSLQRRHRPQPERLHSTALESSPAINRTSSRGLSSTAAWTMRDRLEAQRRRYWIRRAGELWATLGSWVQLEHG